MSVTEESPSADRGPQEDARPSLVRRLLLRAPTGRKRLLLVAGGVVFLSSAMASVLLLHKREVHERTVSIEMAFEALDQGRIPEARRYAEALGDSGSLTPEANSDRSFVLGAVMIDEAQTSWADETAKYMLAAKHLENSRDRGFPKGREGQGYFLLGEALHNSGQYVQSRRWLREALHADPRKAKEINRLLSSAYRNDPNPKWSQALEYNTAWLADPGLGPQERNTALLERGQILFELGQINACRETLTQIEHNSANRADATLMRGRILLDEARQYDFPENPENAAGGTPTAELADPLYEQAIQAFREAQGQDTLDSKTTRKAMFLIGVCLSEMQNRRTAAVDQLTRTRRIYPDSPEAVAASLLEGDLERWAGQDAEAAAAYREALQAAGDPLVYANPWVPLDELTSRITAAYQAFLDGGKFAEALALLEDYTPLFPADKTVELQSQTQSAWGESLLETAQRTAPSQRDPVEREAWEHFIKAGYGFSDLARRHATSRQYPDDIWRSGEAFNQGHDFVNATQVLTIYLKYETRQHLPAALVAFAKASLAQGKTDQAITALRQCIDFHARDVAAYEARIWCAKALRDKGQFAEAEEMLTTNLRLSGLAPSSPEWRESLYELGFLLHEDGRYSEAIKVLQEAVDRAQLDAPGDQPPYAPEVVQAIYTIAESYRLQADEPRARSAGAEVESDRQAMQRQFLRQLDQAAVHYTQLRALLNQRQENFELTELDQAVLRNCYFSLGGVLFDMGRYEEAIKAYSDAEARYQNDPLVLEIYVQVANCYSRMNRPIEARGQIERAKAVLNRLPLDGPYLASTNYSREEWEVLLNQLGAW